MYIKAIVEEYLRKNDLLVQENANKNESAIKLFHWIIQKYLIEPYIENFIPDDLKKWWKINLVYPNKLYDGGFLLPYCEGFNTELIIKNGLITSGAISKPPKHLDSAIDQITNFIMMVCQELTGAVGVNAIELYLAPFVKYDKLDYKQVKQCIQRFFYNLNYTTRVGYQTPFSNCVIQIGIPEFIENRYAYVGGRIVGKLVDYIDEAKIILKAIFENILEGDAFSRPFTFPIFTVIYTPEFEKLLNEDPELHELFWKAVSERGQPYMLNSLKYDAKGVYSFCCRLTSDCNKVMKFVYRNRGGIWVFPESTGSYTFVTINMAGLAMYTFKNYGREEKYVYDVLIDLLTSIRKYLKELRKWYEKLHKLGLYPMRKIYNPNFPTYHYGTFGIACIAEYVSLILNEPQLWIREIDFEGRMYKDEIIRVYRRTLEYINKIVDEFMEEDKILYNVEEVPGEFSTVKFARRDYELYPEFKQFIPKGKDPYTGNEEVFYTTQLTPEYTTYRIETQLEIEGQCQKLFTGGVMKHIYAHKPIEPEYVEKLCKKALIEHGVYYLGYTPTQSICLDCGYRTTALIWECPKCSSTNVEQWSRIVGYYRPVRNWNPGRRAAFTLRKGI